MTRRIRSPNQIEEEKKVWDEEGRLIRNAKAREARARKKVKKEAQNLLILFNNLIIAFFPLSLSNFLF